MASECSRQNMVKGSLAGVKWMRDIFCVACVHKTTRPTCNRGTSGPRRSPPSSAASIPLRPPHPFGCGVCGTLTSASSRGFLFIRCRLGSEIQRREISGLSPPVVLQGWPGAWQLLQPPLNGISHLLSRLLTVVGPSPTLCRLSMLAGRGLRIV